MIAIEDLLIADSVSSVKFACDLKKCKGACCVEGVAGPPVTAEEVKIIKKLYPKIKHRLRPEGIAVIEEKGVAEKWEGMDVLTCVSQNECVFVTFDEKKIAFCGIEQAYFAGEVDFRKPMSCHLFPIRVRDFFGQKVLNYVESEECKPAVTKGKRDGVYLFEFLKEALVRKFGEVWYTEFEKQSRKNLKKKP